jgi:Lsr2
MIVMAVRGGGTVRVGLDGTGYEIGRTAGHARALRDSLARCVAAVRQAGGGKRQGRERRASASGLNHCGRGVGQSAGIEVKDCARVSAELVATFKAAIAR